MPERLAPPRVGHLDVLESESIQIMREGVASGRTSASRRYPSSRVTWFLCAQNCAGYKK